MFGRYVPASPCGTFTPTICLRYLEHSQYTEPANTCKGATRRMSPMSMLTMCITRESRFPHAALPVYLFLEQAAQFLSSFPKPRSR